jgi:hypothetical protein
VCVRGSLTGRGSKGYKGRGGEGGGRGTWALTERGSHGQMRACEQLFSCGGNLRKRCPHISTRLAGLLLAALYKESCSQGVEASKVAPKFVGPTNSLLVLLVP